MKYLMILAFCITACGQDNSARNSSDELDPNAAANPEEYAQLIEKESDRPECKSKHSLIYIKETKEFQSCDGKGTWSKVEVANNTTVQNTTVQTTTNVNAASNIMSDQDHEWIYFRNVQKSNIQKAGKICPTDYAPATKAQIESQLSSGELLAGIATTSFTKIWSSDLDVVSFYLSGSTLMWDWLTSGQIAALKSTSVGLLCIK